MKYCINIESTFKKHSFRLNNSDNWIKCVNHKIINEHDKIFNDCDDLASIQEPDKKVILDGIEFEILSDLGYEFGNVEQLSYVVYGFRKEFPSPPDLNQLKSLLINGNDTVRNILVLKTDGQFYLYSQSQIRFQIVEKDIVVQFEGFQPGNGFVGETINDGSIDNYTQNMFRKSMYYWRNHLVDNEMHDHTEIVITEEDQIPQIIDLFSDLNSIKENWVSK